MLGLTSSHLLHSITQKPEAVNPPATVVGGGFPALLLRQAEDTDTARDPDGGPRQHRTVLDHDEQTALVYLPH